MKRNEVDFDILVYSSVKDSIFFKHHEPAVETFLASAVGYSEVSRILNNVLSITNHGDALNYLKTSLKTHRHLETITASYKELELWHSIYGFDISLKDIVSLDKESSQTSRFPDYSMLNTSRYGSKPLDVVNEYPELATAVLKGVCAWDVQNKWNRFSKILRNCVLFDNKEPRMLLQELLNNAYKYFLMISTNKLDDHSRIDLDSFLYMYISSRTYMGTKFHTRERFDGLLRHQYQLNPFSDPHIIEYLCDTMHNFITENTLDDIIYKHQFLGFLSKAAGTNNIDNKSCWPSSKDDTTKKAADEDAIAISVCKLINYEHTDNFSACDTCSYYISSTSIVPIGNIVEMFDKSAPFALGFNPEKHEKSQIVRSSNNNYDERIPLLIAEVDSGNASSHEPLVFIFPDQLKMCLIFDKYCILYSHTISTIIFDFPDSLHWKHFGGRIECTITGHRMLIAAPKLFFLVDLDSKEQFYCELTNVGACLDRVDADIIYIQIPQKNKVYMHSLEYSMNLRSDVKSLNMNNNSSINIESAEKTLMAPYSAGRIILLSRTTKQLSVIRIHRSDLGKTTRTKLVYEKTLKVPYVERPLINEALVVCPYDENVVLLIIESLGFVVYYLDDKNSTWSFPPKILDESAYDEVLSKTASDLFKSGLAVNGFAGLLGKYIVLNNNFDTFYINRFTRKVEYFEHGLHYTSMRYEDGGIQELKLHQETMKVEMNFIN